MKRRNEIIITIAIITIVSICVSIGWVKLNKPYDFVNSNKTDDVYLTLNSPTCNGLLFKNSTGDKICAPWDDLHDGILYIKNMKREVVVTINNTEVKPQLPTIHMNQTGVDVSPDIKSGNYVTFDDGCKTAIDYNKVTLEDTREYLVSGNCTNADMPMLLKYVKQFLSEKSKELTSNAGPSSEELTQGTNVCTVGFGCPNNATSALTYGTEMQMLWGEIQDQNKKILENQNIMMCLEVVKNPDTWVQVGKYLTERGVNCTGLDIK